MRAIVRKRLFRLCLGFVWFAVVLSAPGIMYGGAASQDKEEAPGNGVIMHAPGKRSLYPPTSEDVYVWCAYALPAENGKIRYGFEFDWQEGQGAKIFTLHTNAGPISVEDFGDGSTATATRSAEVRSDPIDALRVYALEIDGKPASLDLLARQDDEAARYPWETKKVEIEDSARSPRPDPRLFGKRLRLTLSPTRAVNMGIGIYIFSAVGEEGFPPLQSVAITYLTPETRYRDEETITCEQDTLERAAVASGAPWSCQLAAEAFMVGGYNSASLVAPDVFVITSAIGMLDGEKVNVVDSIDIAPFKPMPVMIEQGSK